MAPTLTVLAVVLSLLCQVQNSAASSFGATTQSLLIDVNPQAADQGTGGASPTHEGRGLVQITPAPQEVIDAALAATLNLLEFNEGEYLNSAVSYNVPCEVYQRVEGPYLLNNAYFGLPPTFVIRSCTFLDDAPILLQAQNNLCVPGCSPQGCPCCDGTLNGYTPGADNNTCPLYEGTTCDVCQTYYDAGFGDIASNPATLRDLILVDLDAGTSVDIAYFFVPPTIGTLPNLPPNSFTSGPPFGFGAGVKAVGPFGITGYYAYIPPSQLKKGGRYQIGRKPVPGSTAQTYYYEFRIADSTPCDPQSAAPNQCFNVPGSASVCCAGQCPNAPIALPSCKTAPTAAATSAPVSTGSPAPTTPSPTGATGSPAPTTPSPTSAPGSPAPTTSAPSPTGSTSAPTATAKCDPYGPLPNQCFNAAGTASVCCAGGCPSNPGPNPFCG